MKRSLIARLICLSLTALPCSIIAQSAPTAPMQPQNSAVVDVISSLTEPEVNAQSVESTESVTPSASNDLTDHLMADALNEALSQSEQALFHEPDDEAMRIAFLMPPKGSPFEAPSLSVLKGLLASNYASKTPFRILLIHPGSDNSVISQLELAAQAGAMAAVGPIERNKVEELGRLQYLPLPVITLNQVDLDHVVPLTEEEIAAQKERLRMEQLLAEQQPESGTSEISPDASGTNTSVKEPLPSNNSTPTNPTDPNEGVRINVKAAIPGLVYADELAVSKVRFDPKVFPRNLLMLGLSMEDDAAYVARLGVAALPDTTESGNKPKVLLLDHDTPLEKRISEAFERELVDAGYAPDRMTVDINDIRRVNQFFSLVVDKLDKDEFDEVLIDQEADPVGWRQQQIRIRRLQAAKRARAALSEPPYYAAFLAMDAKSASLVRSRLPLRTRVWGTPIINPGDTKNNPQAKAATYDLMHVALTEAPLLLNYDITAFEEKYQVPAPQTMMDTRLFALGADAWSLASAVAVGTSSGAVEGCLGTLHYNLSVSPLVERRGQTAMIYGGSIRSVSQQEVLDYQAINVNSKSRPLSRLRAQSRSLDRLEREAQRAAEAAGTLAPKSDVLQDNSSLMLQEPSSFELPAQPQQLPELTPASEEQNAL